MEAQRRKKWPRSISRHYWGCPDPLHAFLVPRGDLSSSPSRRNASTPIGGCRESCLVRLGAFLNCWEGRSCRSSEWGMPGLETQPSSPRSVSHGLAAWRRDQHLTGASW